MVNPISLTNSKEIQMSTSGSTQTIERPEVGTTLVKRTEFGDKLVAAFEDLDRSSER